MLKHFVCVCSMKNAVWLSLNKDYRIIEMGLTFIRFEGYAAPVNAPFNPHWKEVEIPEQKEPSGAEGMTFLIERLVK